MIKVHMSHNTYYIEINGHRVADGALPFFRKRPDAVIAGLKKKLWWVDGVESELRRVLL